MSASRWYAQRGEDERLLHAFAGQTDGFFVDVGAGHPVIGSLTKLLVDRLSWRGINIEPQREWFACLCRERPDDLNLCLAVGETPDVSIMYTVPEDPAITTLDNLIAKRYEVEGLHVEKQIVPVLPLDLILDRLVEPGFDLLKIDVEGKERDVINSADMTYWRPRVLVVEAMAPGSYDPSHQEWEPAILSSGYTLACSDGLNRFYAIQTEPSLLERLRQGCPAR
jgi:FkbM family methyltransferase